MGAKKEGVTLLQMAGGIHPGLMYSSKNTYYILYILLSTFEKKQHIRRFLS
jgi:hypothetical protein